MPHGRRRYLRRVGALAASTVLAGCVADERAEDGDPDDTPTTGTGTTVVDTETTVAAQTRFPDYDWSKLSGVDPVPTTTITMSGFEFVPLVATMRPGATVRVTNEDSATHTMSVPALDLDPRLDGGESTTFGVVDEGAFDYVCEFHGPGMLGRLVVSEDAPTPTPTGADGTATASPTPTSSPTDTPSQTPTDTPTESDGGYPASGGG